MVDQEHFEKLNDRVDELERIQLERGVRQDEQIKSLYESVRALRNVVYGVTIILLLTVVWGAIGEKGFHAVTSAAISQSK